MHCTPNGELDSAEQAKQQGQGLPGSRPSRLYDAKLPPATVKRQGK
jgi:hypothetical protein